MRHIRALFHYLIMTISLSDLIHRGAQSLVVENPIEFYLFR